MFDIIEFVTFKFWWIAFIGIIPVTYESDSNGIHPIQIEQSTMCIKQTVCVSWVHSTQTDIFKSLKSVVDLCVCFDLDHTHNVNLYQQRA